MSGTSGWRTCASMATNAANNATATDQTPATVGDQTVQFRKLLVKLYPQKAHVFNQ